MKWPRAVHVLREEDAPHFDEFSGERRVEVGRWEIESATVGIGPFVAQSVSGRADDAAVEHEV